MYAFNSNIIASNFCINTAENVYVIHYYKIL